MEGRSGPEIYLTGDVASCTNFVVIRTFSVMVVKSDSTWLVGGSTLLIVIE